MNDHIIQAGALEMAAEAIRDLWESDEPATPETEARAALEAATPLIMAEWEAERKREERDRDLEDKSAEARAEWLDDEKGDES